MKVGATHVLDPAVDRVRPGDAPISDLVASGVFGRVVVARLWFLGLGRLLVRYEAARIAIELFDRRQDGAEHHCHHAGDHHLVRLRGPVHDAHGGAVSPVRPTLLVVGRRLEPEDHRLRDFLTRSAQPRVNGVPVYFAQQNCGKRCISIDLRTDRAKAVGEAWRAGTGEPHQVRRSIQPLS